MAKSSTEILVLFQKKLQSLEKTRVKFESLYLEKVIGKRDIEEIYCSLFVTSMVSFEASIETLFLGILAKTIKPPTIEFDSKRVKVKPSIYFKDTPTARKFVLHGKKYFSWLPYENTIKIAKIFFNNGFPFTCIESRDDGTGNNHRKILEKCLIIRNVLAHQSNHAKERFENEILNDLSINKQDRNPKSFLRVEFASSPKLNYYQRYTSELLRILDAIC